MARKFVAASSQKIVFGSALVTAVPLTIACWFNPVSNAVAYRLFGISDGSNSNLFCVGQTSGGKVDATTVGAGSLTSAASVTASTTSGTWAHACAVFASATDRRAFLNGTNKGTDATSKTPSGLNATDIGFDGSGTFANANIAECAIWNITLADAEVAALANGVAAWLIHPEALKFYAPLSMGYSPEINIISNTNTGTITGATLIDGPAITYGRRSRFR